MDAARARWESARAILSSQRAGPPLRRVESAFPVPASFGQRRVWLVERIEPGRPLYNLALELRCSGELDVGALTSSLSEVVRRHEALRSTLFMAGGQLMQRVMPARELLVPMEVLGEVPGAARDEVAGCRARAEARRVFDLERGPLLRARLLKVAARDHRLLLTVHHLAFDGWSYGVLLRELEALYAAAVGGLPSPLSEPEFQYSDFSSWQRANLLSGRLEVLLAWWREQLAAPVEALRLPFDRPRTLHQPRRAAQRSRLLPASLSRELRGLSGHEGVTLFTTLLAAYQTLLHRYSGNEQIVVGTPVANRAAAGLEGMIGQLVNTVVLRTDLSGAPSFRALLSRVHKTVLGALAHQDLPFELLVAELARERHGTATPMFQAAFAFQNVPRASWTVPGLEVAVSTVPTGDTEFDLTLFMQEAGDGLQAVMEFDEALFDAATIERMLENFEVLLQGIVDGPEHPIAVLPVVAPSQRAALADWNTTSSAYPRDRALWDVFQEVVRRAPGAQAVVSGEVQRTWAELEQDAQRLSRVLRTRRCPGPLRVGLFLERSLDFVVAVLATLEAGGAYVPVDPAAPVERTAGLLLRAGVTDVVTSPAHAARARGLSLPLVLSDADCPAEAPRPPRAPVDAAATACVMFTSGTTGSPRGVEVSHRGILRTVCGTNYVCLGPGDVLLLHSPLAFDASTFELWGALVNGATLVVAPPHPLSMQELGALVRRHRVTTLWLTSGLFERFVDADQGPLPLKQLLTGGDVASPAHAHRFVQTAGGCRLVNCYGPTENTTFSTWYLVPAGVPAEGPLPIGRPVSNSTLHVLDERLQPVPRGVEGEAWVGGDGVAAGYLGDAQATAERFIPNPFGPGRLYRTGDRVRLGGDGNLRFLGRRDEQVKIRGFRIQPSEVEGALRALAGVEQALVVARARSDGKRELVAYVTGAGDGPRPDLIEALRARLPEYLLPSAVVAVAELPLTANGKIDRDALPAPRQFVRRQGDPPRDDLERCIAAVFEELLGVSAVGRDDDFFALGGDSLLAVELVTRLEQVLGRAVPLSAVFLAPTLAGVAGEVRPQSLSSIERPSSSFVEVRRGDKGPPLFLVPGGHGGREELALYAKLARDLSGRRAFYGFVARGLDGVSVPHASVEQMASDYADELRRLQPVGPYHLVGECVGGVIAYEMAQQLLGRGERIALLLLMDSWCPSLLRALRHRLTGRSALRPGVSAAERNYVEVAHRYWPRPFPGKLTLLATEECVGQGIERPWRKLATGGLVTHVVPGDHASYVRSGVAVTAARFAHIVGEAR